MTGPGNFDDEFEKGWREAFSDSAETPPDSVWKELDRQLLYSELAATKGKNRMYKWGMAASLLLVSFLGVSLYTTQSDQVNNRVLTGIVDINSPEETSFALNIPEREETSSSTSFLGRKLAVAQVSTGSEGDESNDFNDVDLEKFELEHLSIDLMVASNTDKVIYGVPSYDHISYARKSDGGYDKYWAGLNVASGSFDPNYQSGNSTLVSSNANAAFSNTSNELIDSQGPSLREGMSSGETIAMGLSFGFKLSDRWSLESGLQYARADATTTTNIVIESSRVQEVIPASAEIRSIPQVVDIIDSEDVLEYNYKDVDLANQFQFATIPVKAGYQILDKKFRVQLNAGFAANLYLGNKLSDPDNEIANVTIGPGDSSPYRELSFSGLAGLQFGYQFLRNFDVILEPNYRQSISSLTKENSTFSANPSGFGIMTGIRYNFN